MMRLDSIAALSAEPEEYMLHANQVWVWVVFNLGMLALLFLDLGVLHRRQRALSLKESLLGVTFWVVLALAFNGLLLFWRGPERALEFFTGYLIEYSLSIDNMFVFLLIFSYFRVPAPYQYRVLFWGIFGALVMRALFIILGIALLRHFHGIIYIFGIFLVLTGFKMLGQKGRLVHPEKNPLLRLFRRWLPLSEQYEGGRFMVRRGGRWLATPLLVVLLVVETTDLFFAFDSIPAILAVTTDPFIVYSSNVFAILGLRALYFALAGMMSRFHQLHYGLALILIFVGIKMLLADVFRMPTGLALGVIAALLALSVLASLIRRRRPEQGAPLAGDH